MKPETNNCIFCQIINHQLPAAIIYETKTVMAFLDVNPTDIGHVLVIPKQHVPTFLTAPVAVLAEVQTAAQKVALALQQVLTTDNFNIVINNGILAYQLVFHYHVHVIPKFSRNQGYILHRNPPSPLDEAKKQQLVEQLRASLNG